MTTLNTVGPVPNAPWRLQRKVAAKAAQAFVAVKARAGMTSRVARSMAWPGKPVALRGLREVAVCRPQGNLDKSGRSGLDSSGFDCDWLQPYCSTSPCCSRCLARQFLPGSPLDSPEAQEIELGARRCKETPSSSRGSARESKPESPSPQPPKLAPLTRSHKSALCRCRRSQRSFGLAASQTWCVSSARRQTLCKHLAATDLESRIRSSASDLTPRLAKGPSQSSS